MSNSQTDIENLKDIGRLLKEAPVAMYEVTSRFSWEPVPTSELDIELKNTEQGPAGSWGDKPIELGRQHVQFWLIVAARQMSGLGTLYLNDELIGSPWPVCRSVLETCGAAAWLLEASNVRQRAARAFLVELEDYRQARNATDHALGLPPGQGVTPEAAAYAHYRDIEIPGLFNSVSLTGKGKRHIEGEVMPQYSQLVGHLIDTHLRGGSGKEAYSYLSCSTHPTSSGYRRLFHHESGAVQLRPEVTALANGARLALIVHYKTLASVIEHYGWGLGADVLSFWEKQINGAFPGSIDS